MADELCATFIPALYGDACESDGACVCRIALSSFILIFVSVTAPDQGLAENG